ncbi:MAG: hypothetical protein II008_05405 [Oscillospiraceae bacterium]|nr:hypothetical protein [Oscillospiraceae bacterium]
MDMMTIRKMVMAQMANGVPKLIKTVTITCEKTGTNLDRITVQMLPRQNAFIVVLNDIVPESDPNIYITQEYSGYYLNGAAVLTAGSIKRPNGTNGTDAACASFIPSTGVVELGGSYGYFPEGATYHLYEFEF